MNERFHCPQCRRDVEEITAGSGTYACEACLWSGPLVAAPISETAWLPLTITDGRKLEVRLVVSDGEAVLCSRDPDNPREERMEVMLTASGGLVVIKKGNFQQRGTT